MFVVHAGVKDGDDHASAGQSGGVNLASVHVAVACSDGLRGHVVGGHKHVLHFNHNDALEAPNVQQRRNGNAVKDDGIQALWEVKPRASFLADPAMRLEDGAECGDLGISGVPREIDHDRDGEAAIRPFDGGRRDGGRAVQHALQAVVHAVAVQVRAVPQPPPVVLLSHAFCAVRPTVRCGAKLVTAHEGRDALHHVDAWFGLGKQGFTARCGRSCDHQNEKKEGHARAACTLVRTSAHH